MCKDLKHERAGNVPEGWRALLVPGEHSKSEKLQNTQSEEQTCEGSIICNLLGSQRHWGTEVIKRVLTSFKRASSLCQLLPVVSGSREPAVGSDDDTSPGHRALS